MLLGERPISVGSVGNGVSAALLLHIIFVSCCS